MRVGDSAELGGLRVGSSVVRGIARGSNSDLGLPDWSSLEFFDRAGVSNSGAKTKIDSFVRYCKNTGIWSSLYCFPLINTQNPNLEPLGGLVNTATNTADRINLSGPIAIGIEGLVFNGSTALATFDTAGLVGGNAFVMFAVARVNAMSAASRGTIFSARNNSWRIGQPANSAASATVYRTASPSLSTTGFFNNTDHNLLVFSQNSNGGVIFSRNSDNQVGTGSAPTALDSTFNIGTDGSATPTFGGSFNGAVSFVGVIQNVSWVSGNQSATGLYNELKANLLNGLLA